MGSELEQEKKVRRTIIEKRIEKIEAKVGGKRICLFDTRICLENRNLIK
jgi:hypothetical protein